MAEPHEIRKTALALAPMQRRQMSIAFESSVLRRLTDPERLKALTHLAHPLMLAASVAAEERDDGLRAMLGFNFRANYGGFSRRLCGRITIR